MTMLVGVVGAGANDVRSGKSRALAALDERAGSVALEWSSTDVALAARCHPWEQDIGGWVGPALCDVGDYVVAADASLYYERDLRRRLARGNEDRLWSISAELVAAAVRRWGDDFAGHLEGDYAVLVWDKARRRLLATRDLVGRRALCVGHGRNGTTILATSPLTALAVTAVPRELDVDAIATAAAGLPADEVRTAYAAIQWIPTGRTLAVDASGIRNVASLRVPPFSDAWNGGPSDADADHLRWLIECAVLERLPAGRAAAVWMSGGYDSTAVFAAGRSAAARAHRDVDILPVSLAYPQGDPGNEDEYVNAIADAWKTPVTWVDIEAVSLLDPAPGAMRASHDIVVHPFDASQRALARASLDLGARIVLDGLGGDQLFLASDAYLADHLLFGRLALLAQGWRRRKDRSLRAFLTTCVLPLAPYEFVDYLHDAFGIKLDATLEFPVPEWMVPREALRAGSRAVTARDANEALTAYRAKFLLENQHFPRLFSTGHLCGVEEGVQGRSPLLDRRVMEFAVRRPVNERRDGGETKLLLRRAMRELLPANVLRRRRQKGGLPIGYVKRQLLRHMETTIRPMFGDGRRIWLEELGVINRRVFHDVLSGLNAESSSASWGKILPTVRAELWLAARAGDA